MFSSPLKTIICLGVMATFFTGCATKTLMTKDNKTYTRTNKVTLIALYTTNFTEPLSYQDSAFLKLPKFP
ncbi:hypothetical protein [Acinetobacter johnsonii]|uniref:hypothetical protein n=1 Tax=Acinetobacter johnsonii TaxID=40214 RepID=UPI003AF77EBC